jgi:hypothetical protein
MEELPKEKAAYLIVNYQLKCKSLNYDEAKECALIAVNEILDAIKIELDVDLSTTDVVNFASNKIIYWQKVKQEIEILYWQELKQKYRDIMITPKIK